MYTLYTVQEKNIHVSGNKYNVMYIVHVHVYMYMYIVHGTCVSVLLC